MNDPIRYRYTRPLERFEPYAFLFGWILSWVLPYYGLMTWVIVFAPEGVVVPLWRRLWGSIPPRVATVRRTEGGVDLESADGAAERIVHADVDALTSVCDKTGAATALRLERKNGRTLVFEVSGTTPEQLATAIGVDPAKTRRRFALSARLIPRGSLFILLGFGAIGWSLFGRPSPETAWYLLLYQRAILMPLVVLYAVPTAFDVGADGFSWRWLFWRKYHAFAAVTSIVPRPGDVPMEKAGSFVVTTSDGEVRTFFGAARAGTVPYLLQAFTQSRDASKASATVDDWLPRGAKETVCAWIERLRAMGANDGSYRGVSVNHLWTLAEDASAAVSARLGAALVLGAREASRTRLLVIAGQVVDPAFSSVLEAVAREASVSELERLARPFVAD